MCLNVLVSLISSSYHENIMLKSACMKQMTKLCIMKFDYLVYPHLSKELVLSKSVQFPENYRLEMLYTIAFCIHDIVSYRFEMFS